MEPLRIGFLGAGGFARHTIYPALHLAPSRITSRLRCRRRSCKRRCWQISVQADTTPIDTKCLKRKTWKQSSYPWDPTQGNRLCLKLSQQDTTSSYRNLPRRRSRKRLTLGGNRRTAWNKTLMVNFQRRFSLGVREATANYADRILRTTHPTLLLVLQWKIPNSQKLSARLRYPPLRFSAAHRQCRCEGA